MKTEFLLSDFNMGEILELDFISSGIITDQIPSFFYGIGSGTVRLIAQAVKHAPTTVRDAVTVKMLNRIKPTILKWTDNRIHTGNTPILKDIEFSTSERRKQEMRISVEIGDVQFDQIVIAALPLILETLRKRENMKMINNIFDILDDDVEVMISGIFASVSEDKQRKIAELLLSNYHGAILDIANHYIKKRNLSARVKDIAVDF